MENTYRYDRMGLKTEQKYTQQILNIFPQYKILEYRYKYYKSGYSVAQVHVWCGTEGHPSYWTNVSVLLKGHQCKMCNKENFSKHAFDRLGGEEYLRNLCSQRGYHFINFELSVKKLNNSKITMKDKNGYYHYVTLETLRWFSESISDSPFSKKNPYKVENAKLWCKLNRPDYEFVDDHFSTVHDMYLFKYIGNFPMADEDRMFYCRWSNFTISQSTHPKIKISRNTRVLYEYLKSKKYLFYQEYPVEGMVSSRGKSLFFDFFLPQYNTAIEVDGEQHFQPIKVFGGLARYKIQQDNDKKKNDFCVQHKIKIIRLSYLDFESDNYKTIINNNLNAL